MRRGPTAKALLPGLIDGSTPAAVAFWPGRRRLRRASGAQTAGSSCQRHLPGRARGRARRRVVLVPVDAGDGRRPEWRTRRSTCATSAGDARSGRRVVARGPASTAPAARRSWSLDRVRGVRATAWRGGRPPGVDDLAVVLAAAELTGSARWCLETATEHARTRVQFGRPIGQFQGVKHKLANLLAVVEQMTAATWDAALARSTATTRRRPTSRRPPPARCALEGGVGAARDAIQVLGGMGFTWEHDAHLHLRRAATLRQLLGARRLHTAPRWPPRPSAAAAAPSASSCRPARPSPLRAELGPVVAWSAAADPADQPAAARRVRACCSPHWPAPYGRDAGPVEQLVVDELLAEAGIRRPPANVAAWALPTLIAHGTPEQRDRFVLPTLRGEMLWCQLFCEPGAAATSRRSAPGPTRAEGGWVLDGQKVWTSVAAPGRLGHLPRADRPRRPKARGHHLLPRGHEGPRASRSVRSANSPATRCSTRSSWTAASSPTTASWER